MSGTNETSEKERIETLVRKQQNLLRQKAIAEDRLATARIRWMQPKKKPVRSSAPMILINLLHFSKVEEPRTKRKYRNLQKIWKRWRISWRE